MRRRVLYVGAGALLRVVLVERDAADASDSPEGEFPFCRGDGGGRAQESCDVFVELSDTDAMGAPCWISEGGRGRDTAIMLAMLHLARCHVCGSVFCAPAERTAQPDDAPVGPECTCALLPSWAKRKNGPQHLVSCPLWREGAS